MRAAREFFSMPLPVATTEDEEEAKEDEDEDAEDTEEELASEIERLRPVTAEKRLPPTALVAPTTLPLDGTAIPIPKPPFTSDSSTTLL